MTEFKNVGELLSFTEDEKIPYLNQQILMLTNQLAAAQATIKHLSEEYSKVYTHDKDITAKYIELGGSETDDDQGSNTGEGQPTNTEPGSAEG